MANEPGAPTPPAAPEQTVPKAEFERVTKDLESLKAQLLDPEYLEYLGSKKLPPAGHKPAAAPQSVATMSVDQLRQLIIEHSTEAVKQAIVPIAGRLNEVQAVLEAEAVKAKYPDFNKFAGDIVTLLESEAGSNLTIEQAYLISKNAKAPSEPPKPPEGTPPAPPAKPPASGEKPGSTLPVDGQSGKTFKTSADAGTAAWSEVSQKYGLSGDTI